MKQLSKLQLYFTTLQLDFGIGFCKLEMEKKRGFEKQGRGGWGGAFSVNFGIYVH